MSTKTTTAVVATVVSKKKSIQKNGVTLPKGISLTGFEVGALRDYIEALENVMRSKSPEDIAQAKNDVSFQIGLHWHEIYQFSREAQAVGSYVANRHAPNKSH